MTRSAEITLAVLLAGAGTVAVSNLVSLVPFPRSDNSGTMYPERGGLLASPPTSVEPAASNSTNMLWAAGVRASLVLQTQDSDPYPQPRGAPRDLGRREGKPRPVMRAKRLGPQHQPAGGGGETRRPGRSHPSASGLYTEAIDYIHLRESRRGADPRCRRGVVGAAGERGSYQITPPFAKDCARLGWPVDVYSPASCQQAVRAWLSHYAPRVGAVTNEDLWQLYRRGPSGFRRWKGSRP